MATAGWMTADDYCRAAAPGDAGLDMGATGRIAGG